MITITDNIDMTGHRVRNAGASTDSTDYIRRDELTGVLDLRNDLRYLRRDGGNAPTADINLNGHTLVNLRDAVGAQEPITKAQYDAAINAILVRLNNLEASLRANGYIP